jgi:hypothetical protein
MMFFCAGMRDVREREVFVTKTTSTRDHGLRLLLVLFALFSLNAAADTLSFAYVELPPSYIPTFPPAPGTTSASFSGTINGATNGATANLATGTLGVLSAGNDVSVTSPTIFESIAQLGDTITATSTASGLSGLSLGVNISETGTTSFSDSSQNFSWIWVYMFTPGTFDQSQFTLPGNVLASEGFLLGNGTNTNIADELFTANDVAVDGTFGDGTNTIPITIPFDTIGSNFQIEIVLGTSQFITTPAPSTWSADFLDPLTVSLSAPAGVTLTSASGVLPGTQAAVPEPSSWVLVASAIGVVVLVAGTKRRRKAS